MITIPHPGADQPQRRPAAVRARRLPLHRDRRRWRRRRSGRERAEPGRAARQAAPDRPAPREPRLPRARRQPVRRRRRRAAARSGATACATRSGSRSTGATGDLTIGDVGQSDLGGGRLRIRRGGGGRGVNWGWDCREGAHDYEARRAARPALHRPGARVRARRRRLLGHRRLRRPRSRPDELAAATSTPTSARARSARPSSRLPAATGDRSEDLTVSSISLLRRGRLRPRSTSRRSAARSRGSSTTRRPTARRCCRARLRLPTCPPSRARGPAGSTPDPADPDPATRTNRRAARAARSATATTARPAPRRQRPQELIGRGGDDALRGTGRDCLDGGARRRLAQRRRRARRAQRRDAATTGSRSRDGERDMVACGPGDDRVTADREDRLRGCESAGARPLPRLRDHDPRSQARILDRRRRRRRAAHGRPRRGLRARSASSTRAARRS